MTKSFSDLTLVKIFLLLVLLIILFFTFTDKKIKAAYDFNSYTNNVGIGTSGPSDTTPPIASITNPVNGATVSGVVSYNVNATDDAGITNVEFYVDENSIGVDTSAPYLVFWNTAIYPHNSVHTLIATALDTSGNQASSSAVTITVLDITPPNVTITNPVNGSTVNKNSTVTITANTSDVSGINKVEFYVNNVLRCTDTQATYSCNWQVPAKPKVSYTLQAKAYDWAGNTSTNTSVVTSR